MLATPACREHHTSVETQVGGARTSRAYCDTHIDGIECARSEIGLQRAGGVTAVATVERLRHGLSADEQHSFARKDVVGIAEQEFHASDIGLATHFGSECFEIGAVAYECYFYDVAALGFRGSAGCNHELMSSLDYRISSDFSFVFYHFDGFMK